jgi:hypothetical protein
METAIVKENWLEQQAKQFEAGRFGWMTIMMTAQSCWGSIAAMYALKFDHIVLLIITAIVTMASNAAFIAQSPAKWCLGIFYTSVIANLIVFLIAFFGV